MVGVNHQGPNQEINSIYSMTLILNRCSIINNSMDNKIIHNIKVIDNITNSLIMEVSNKDRIVVEILRIKIWIIIINNTQIIRLAKGLPRNINKIINIRVIIIIITRIIIIIKVIHHNIIKIWIIEIRTKI